MSSPFISEIKLFPWSWAPKYWALCNGALLPINQYQALFSLLGTTYGGNGVSNFALPDLRSRTPISFGTNTELGEVGGTETVLLSINQMPMHNHMFMANVMAGAVAAPADHFLAGNANKNNFYGLPTPIQPLNPASIGPVGGTQPHTNMQPYLVLNYCIAVQGVFPSRN